VAQRGSERGHERDLIEAGLNEAVAAAVQRKELQGQFYSMNAGLECVHNLEVTAPRPSTHRGETNALELQKILILSRRCCFEIAFSKMSPLIRLHLAVNPSKYAAQHQDSRGNSPSSNKLQRGDSRANCRSRKSDHMRRLSRTIAPSEPGVCQ
jgi:hypothetical protein